MPDFHVEANGQVMTLHVPDGEPLRLTIEQDEEIDTKVVITVPAKTPPAVPTPTPAPQPVRGP